MEDNYKIWDIDRLLQSYKEVPDIAEIVKSTMEHLFIFLEKNSLLKCTVSDGKGNLTKRLIMKDELTEEGMKIAIGPKNPVHRWLGSKGSQKIPPNMSLLEKALAEIRRNA